METAIAWLLTFAPITMSPGPSNMKSQGKIFGGLLVLVAVWMLRR